MSRIESLVRWDESLNVLVETIGAAQDLLREASHETERALDRDDVDESRFEAVDRRVGRFFDLSRKFRVEPNVWPHCANAWSRSFCSWTRRPMRMR